MLFGSSVSVISTPVDVRTLSSPSSSDPPSSVFDLSSLVVSTTRFPGARRIMASVSIMASSLASG